MLQINIFAIKIIRNGPFLTFFLFSSYFTFDHSRYCIRSFLDEHFFYACYYEEGNIDVMKMLHLHWVVYISNAFWIRSLMGILLKVY